MPAIDTEVKSSWADAIDEADEESLPLPTETFNKSTGIKTTVEYKFNNDDKKVKVESTFKMETRKVSKSIAKRKAWKKFGAAARDGAGPNPANTILSVDDVYMTFVGGRDQAQEEAKAEDPLAKIKENKAGVTCRLCKGPHWTTKCPYKDQLSDVQASMGALDAKAAEENPSGEAPAAPGTVGSSGKAPGGKYVPPGARGGDKQRQGESMKYGRGGEEVATIRVTNLSEDTRETDLQDLFKPFGSISRIYLAKDKVTGQSKGFAFINYYKREDAAKAIAGVSGYGYDHLILNVEWAKPQGDK